MGVWVGAGTVGVVVGVAVAGVSVDVAVAGVPVEVAVAGVPVADGVRVVAVPDDAGVDVALPEPCVSSRIFNGRPSSWRSRRTKTSALNRLPRNSGGIAIVSGTETYPLAGSVSVPITPPQW